MRSSVAVDPATGRTERDFDSLPDAMRTPCSPGRPTRSSHGGRRTRVSGHPRHAAHAGVSEESSALMADVLHHAGVPEDAYVYVHAGTDQVAR